MPDCTTGRRMFRTWLRAMVASAIAMPLAAAFVPPAWAQEQADVGALNQQVEQFHKGGKIEQATPIAEQALALAERMLGSEHPDTLRCVKNLGDLYYEQDRNDEAERLFKRALETRDHVLGSEHANTLVSVNDLGVLYQTEKRYGDAEPLFKRALEARERVLGPDHPDTLLSLSNLASLYNAEERAGEAEPLYQRAFQTRERVLGPEHPDTLDSLNDLAGFYLAQKRYGDAEPLMRRGLEASDRVYGKEHIQTLLRVVRLALLYFTQVRLSEAEPLYKRALEIQEHTAGPNAAVTIASVDNLGDLYRVQSRFSDAEPLLQRVLETRQRVLGPDHPDTLKAVSKLGTLYKDQGRRQEAELLFVRALDARERVLGKDAPDTIESVNDLAIVYEAQSRYAEAEPLLQRAVETSERVLGPKHPGTLDSLTNLASHFMRRVRYDDAMPLLQRVLETRERLLGTDAPDTLRSRSKLAQLYQGEGHYAAAEPLFRRALEGYERVLGPEHAETLAALHNLAGLYFMQGRYSEAEPIYQRTLEALERVRGKDHPDTLTAINSLAYLYVVEGRYDAADPLFKRGLEARERLFGKDDPSTLVALNNLAGLYRYEGRNDETESLYKRALAISERTLGKDDPTTLTVVNNLAELSFALGHLDEAEALDRRAMEGFERVLGKEHPQTLFSVAGLAGVYREQGRYGEAVRLNRRAVEAAGRVFGSDHPTTLAIVAGLAQSYFAQSDWPQAARYLRRSTAGLIQRTRRGTQNAGQGQTGRKQSEAELWRDAFVDLVKAAYRLRRLDKGPGSATAVEMFQTAQWALNSEAARSLAQMAARGSIGDPALSTLARERQDLVVEWQDRYNLRNTALGEAATKRDAKAEAENLDRLTAIDARIAVIDKTLAAEFPDYAALANAEPLSVKELQAQLAPDEAMVAFLDTPEEKPTPEETFVWVVTRKGVRWLRTDLGTTALTREVQALRCGLDEEEWATPGNARRCADLLGLSVVPDPSRPLPFDLGKAYALYRALFGQAEDLIAGKRLIIVPSGPLTSLPFHVLVTTKPAKALPGTFAGYRGAAWLGRRNAIVTLPAVSNLKILRRHAAGGRKASSDYAGYGDPLLNGDGASCRLPEVPERCPAIEAARPRGVPALQRSMAVGNSRATIRGSGGRRSANATMDEVFVKGAGAESVLEQVRSLCPLPDTAYEIKCVANRFKEKARLIRLEGEAKESDIKALSASGKLASYGVLHFATHGLLSGDVERMAQRQGEPALVLTPPDKPTDSDDDGLLMASEVAALKLNANWVVLSACNTAAGDKIGAQALSGLARAFFYAGARALLVSHWPVYSDAAVRLTTRAFAELERNPKAGRAEALQHAMSALMDDRSQEDNAHPAVWAPFVVVGEGGR